MKLTRLLASAAVGVTVTLLALPAAAYAASTPTTTAARTHTVTVTHRTIKTTVNPASLHGATGAIVKCNPCTVSVRTACGGFNGHVQWGNTAVSVWGQLWDTCGATSSLWVSYGDLGSPVNDDVKDVNNGTTGVNWSQAALFPGNIGVDVCNTHGGWHCGTTVHV